MKQQTLAVVADVGAGFEQYLRATKRDAFLTKMNDIVQWQALSKVIEQPYPKAGNGRPPEGAGAHIAHVLRAALVQPGRLGL